MEFEVVDGKAKLMNIEIFTPRTDKNLVVNSNAYFKTEQLETFVGDTDNNSSAMTGERRKLIVLHQNGDDKKSLIDQLKTLIDGLETDFEGFAC